MTTGTRGTFPTNPLTAASAYRRDWSGGDGKFESYSGGQRVKWNNLSLHVLSHSCSQPYVTVKRVFAPNGTTVYDQNNVSWDNGTQSFSKYPLSSNLKNKVFDKLLSKVKDHDFNLGVETGQAKQTIGLLAENLRKLGKSALALRRGDFATAARQLGASPRTTRLKPRDISGRWLELQYGWLPLVSSSYDAAKAFESISNGPRSSLFRVRRREPMTFELSTSPSYYSFKFDGFKRRQIQYEMYEEMTIQRQLGLVDPASIAWELTPWSFVIDWFYPFGQYLSNLNQVPALKGRWLVTDTIKCDYRAATVKVTWPPHDGGPNWNSAAIEPYPKFNWGYTHVLRTFSSSPPPVPLPNFVFGLKSSARFWNALSLAHQRFK